MLRRRIWLGVDAVAIPVLGLEGLCWRRAYSFEGPDRVNISECDSVSGTGEMRNSRALKSMLDVELGFGWS